MVDLRASTGASRCLLSVKRDDNGRSGSESGSRADCRRVIETGYRG